MRRNMPCIWHFVEEYIVMGLMDKIFGTHSEKELKKIYPIIDKIEALDSTMQKLSDEELKKYEKTLTNFFDAKTSTVGGVKRKYEKSYKTYTERYGYIDYDTYTEMYDNLWLVKYQEEYEKNGKTRK